MYLDEQWGYILRDKHRHRKGILNTTIQYAFFIFELRLENPIDFFNFTMA